MKIYAEFIIFIKLSMPENQGPIFGHREPFKNIDPRPENRTGDSENGLLVPKFVNFTNPAFLAQNGYF